MQGVTRVLPQMRGSKVHVAELNIEYMPYFDDMKDYTGSVDRLHEQRVETERNIGSRNTRLELTLQEALGG